MEKNNFKTIKLRRTTCYGTCPTHEVNINYSGRVTYKGEMFVEKEGQHEWQISAEAVREIKEALRKVDFFNLKKKDKGVYCTDMPSCITTVEMQDGQKRSIDHYLQTPDFWPPRLKKFEEKIDEIIGTDGYVGDSDGIK